MAMKKDIYDLYRREWKNRLMKKEETAHWIQRTHLFRADAYVCSFCMASFPEPYEICPSCGKVMKKTKYEPSWVDEMETLSAFFED